MCSFLNKFYGRLRFGHYCTHVCDVGVYTHDLHKTAAVTCDIYVFFSFTHFLIVKTCTPQQLCTCKHWFEHAKKESETNFATCGSGNCKETSKNISMRIYGNMRHFG